MKRTIIAAALGLAIPATLGAQAVDEKTAAEICARAAKWKAAANATASEADRKLVAAKALAPGAEFVELAKETKEYEETRRYCLATGNCDRDLAVIFANGWGVKRDYDAATFFLCRSGDLAPAELWSMLGHLEAMRKAARPADLLYCDHAVSGDGQLYCAQLATARKEEEWSGRTAKLRKALSGEAARALDDVAKALEAFAEADAGRLVFGEGGTGYAATAVDAQNGIRETELAGLERRSASRAPGCTPDALPAADAELNRQFRSLRGAPPECSRCSDPGKEWAAALRDAQRAWIRYRDAWSAFYAARWKGAASPEALRREALVALTAERTRQLRDRAPAAQ